MAEEENVQVVLRLRPLSDKEKKNGEENVWKVFEGVSVVLKKEVEDHLPTKKFTVSQSAYNFDKCFGTMASNEMVYESTIRSMVDSAVNGINATVFMYGQTGSGKTFTMLGYDQKKGVYNKTLAEEAKRSKSQKRMGPGNEASFEMKMKQRMACEEAMEDAKLENKTGLLIQALKDLFGKTKSAQDKTFFVKCSYVEIYNDLIFDLLQRAENISETLQVCEDTTKDQFYIRGVREEAIDDWTDAIEKLKRGEINRHYARTVMNHSSSRSHTIFRVYIQALSSSWNNRGGSTGNPAYVTESWFNFVDLAGSEKVSNHDQIEEGNKLQLRVKEGKHINKSLFFLTQVIKLKSEGKKTHIPYRNSPLTKILRSSLGGNSRTAIVLCVNPTYNHLEQTLSTIRFGLSAKKIQNRISANVVTRDDDEAVRIMIADYEKKLRDNEKDRDNLRDRERKLLNRIVGLEKKSVEWAKKMKVTQTLKFADVANSVPERDLEGLLMDYERCGHTHMQDAGILMFPQKKNSRYEKYRSFMKKKAIDDFRFSNPEFVEYDEHMLRQAYHNPSGKWAMVALDRMKKSIECDIALYEKVKSNWEGLELSNGHAEMTAVIKQVTRCSQDNIAKVDVLLNVIEDDRETIKELRERVFFLEGRRDMTRLTAAELDEIAEISKGLERRSQAELRRRETAARLEQEAASLGIPLESVPLLVRLLHPQTEEEVGAPMDEDQDDKEYLEKLRECCKKDSASMQAISVPESASKEKLFEYLVEGCEEIRSRLGQYTEEHSEYWGKYIEMAGAHFAEMESEYKKRGKEGEAETKTAREPEDIRKVWLEVDDILEKCNRTNEDGDESDNMSFSDVSQTGARRKMKNVDKLEEEEEGSGDGEEGQRTPQIGGNASETGYDEDEIEYEIDRDEGDKEGGATEEYLSAEEDSDREREKEEEEEAMARDKVYLSEQPYGGGIENQRQNAQSQADFGRSPRLDLVKQNTAKQQAGPVPGKEFNHSISLLSPRTISQSKPKSSMGTPISSRAKQGLTNKPRISQSPIPVARGDRSHRPEPHHGQRDGSNPVKKERSVARQQKDQGSELAEEQYRSNNTSNVQYKSHEMSYTDISMTDSIIPLKSDGANVNRRSRALRSNKKSDEL